MRSRPIEIGDSGCLSAYPAADSHPRPIARLGFIGNNVPRNYIQDAIHRPDARISSAPAALNCADARLADNLDDWVSRGPTGWPMHASMRAVIDGSWQLLDDPERAMLVALSLLPTGANAPLAAAIAGPEAMPPAHAQRVLHALVAQSVLRVQAGADGEARFAPYEPVREYALAQADPAIRQALRGRLLDALIDWARALPETPPLPAVREELPTLTVVLVHATQ